MNPLNILWIVFLALLLTPRLYYSWAIAAVVLLYAWVWWLVGRPVSINEFSGGIVFAIVAALMLLAASPAFFRWFFGRNAALPERSWKPAQASILFSVIWSVAWFLTPAIPAMVGAITCIIVGLLLSAILFHRAIAFVDRRIWYSTAGTAILTGIIAVSIWPIWVMRAAETRAAERPYCVLVARGSDYRVARNIFDLSPLVMRGREEGGHAYNFHGELLIEGRERRNWSYRYMDFIDVAADYRAVACKPEIRFARKLSWL